MSKGVNSGVAQQTERWRNITDIIENLKGLNGSFGIINIIQYI
jgi:hypothetical protein